MPGTVVDLFAREVIATVPLPGARPSGLSLGPDGRKLYVGGGASGGVFVIDTATLEVGRVPAGPGREVRSPQG